MAFEYNGFVHRDLEPQVRYDAEQVELLKQADVTINENLQTVNESLQTINNEINGKLTKPANPSAESAVTMLADGTVGTKLLSEIGGGGKLYRHDMYMFVNPGWGFNFSIYSSKWEGYTTQTFISEFLKNSVLWGIGFMVKDHTNYQIESIQLSSSNSIQVYANNSLISDFEGENLNTQDTVTEL